LVNRLYWLEQEADAFGFRWENPEQIMSQIESECQEIRDHLHASKTEATSVMLQEEIGDLLHAAFSLCVFCGFSPSDTLDKTLLKFERRLNAVKQLANEQGLTHLNGHSFDELMHFWATAKQRVG